MGQEFQPPKDATFDVIHPFKEGVGALVFWLISVLLLIFALLCFQLRRDVSDLRASVTSYVGALQALSRLRKQIRANGQVDKDLQASFNQLIRSLSTRSDLPVRVEMSLNKLERLNDAILNRGQASQAQRQAFHNEITILVREIRIKTALYSEQLGRRWDHISWVLIASLVLAGVTVVLMAQHLRQRRNLRLLYDQATSLSTARARFLANMNHELRTPLNGIVGALDMLRQTPLSSPQRDFADAIDNSSRKLLLLLRDLVDVAVIEQGELHLELCTFGLREILAEALSDLDGRAKEKQLNLNVRGLEDLPTRVRSDPMRITQVLVHLADNAIKFSDRGVVDITFEASAVDSGGHALSISVKDQGQGIDKELLKAITHPFVQGDVSNKRKHGGSGIGLTIVQAVLTSLGGHLQVESHRGQGSLFRAEIPLDRPLPSENTIKTLTSSDFGSSGIQDSNELGAGERGPSNTLAKPSTVTGGSHVLLVEDNPVNQMVMSTMLKSFGYHVDLAKNGQEAVELFLGKPYPVVLMDCQMPVMDGFEATRKIRSFEKQQRRKPCIIMAVTASADTLERDECYRVGMDQVLGKPVRGEVLKRAVQDAFRKVLL